MARKEVYLGPLAQCLSQIVGEQALTIGLCNSIEGDGLVQNHFGPASSVKH